MRKYIKSGKYSKQVPTSDVSTITPPSELSCGDSGYTKQQIINIMKKPIKKTALQGFWMGVKEG